MRRERFIAVVALIFFAGVARADGDARAHYEKGLSAYGLEHFSEAADEYEIAFSLKSDSALLYNAAQAHRLAGHSERALHLYQSYLRIFGRKVPNREEVERHVRELQTAIASQKRAQDGPPTGVVEPEITSEPQSAAPSPAPAVVTVAPPVSAIAVDAPPPPKPVVKRRWIWGVVVGAAVVVGVGVGLGVGLGSSGEKDPTPIFGKIKVN